MKWKWIVAAVAVIVVSGAALFYILRDDSSERDCGAHDAETTLTVYSGRSEGLVKGVCEKAQKKFHGSFDLQMQYAKSPEMAAKILEEGEDTPADVFFSQDAGDIAALGKKGLLQKLPDSILERVPEEFRSPDGTWVGTSARARVVAYNPQLLDGEEPPQSYEEIVDPKWKGRVGVAPGNASFQVFVTALRESQGEQAAREWLKKLDANEPQIYENNVAILEAVNAGDVDLGLINHYYWYRMQKKNPDELVAKLQFFPGDDPAGLVFPAAVGILKNSDNTDEARTFVEYLLSKEAQKFFANETAEYPLVKGVDSDHNLPEIQEVTEGKTLDVELSSVEETQKLLRDVGLL